MEKQIILSIIIPIYNTNINYVRECVISLIQQQNEHLEIFLINDGSNEFTRNELMKLLKLSPQLILINKVNEGVSTARNTGMKLCSGKWIMFLDSDDKLNLGNLNDLFNLLDDSIDLYFFKYSINENVLSNSNMTPKINILNKKKIEYIRKQICGYNLEEDTSLDKLSYGSCWAKIYKKKFLESNNILFSKNLKMGEDIYFILKLLSYSPKCALIDNIFYFYRIHDCSVCQTYNLSIYNDYETTLKYLKDLYVNRNINDFIVITNTFFLTGLNISIFNKECKKGIRFKKEFLKRHVKSNVFNNSIQNFIPKNYKMSQKILLFLLKHRLYYFTIILKQIQQAGR